VITVLVVILVPQVKLTTVGRWSLVIDQNSILFHKGSMRPMNRSSN
jgi:hypothetical protein